MFQRIRSVANVLCVFACVFAATAAAQAVPLLPGATVTTSGTSLALRPELKGVVVQSTTRNFSISDATGRVVAKGQMYDYVLRESVTGTLDFYYSITTQTGSAPLSLVYRKSFARSTADVDWRTDGLGTAGMVSATRSTAGDLVSLRYDSPSLILAGQRSRTVFIKTDALRYDANGTTFIYTAPINKVRYATSFRTFQPVARQQSKLHFYRLGPPDLSATAALSAARLFGLTRAQTDSTLATYVDAKGVTRAHFDPASGKLQVFPDLTAQFGTAPTTTAAAATAQSFAQPYKPNPPLYRGGSIAVTNILSLARSQGTNVDGKTTTGNRQDIMRTVHLVQKLDEVEVAGPNSNVSVDVASRGVVGVNHVGRRLSESQILVDLLTPTQADTAVNQQIRQVLETLRQTDPNTTFKIASRQLVYYEQGKSYLQPAYRYHVNFTGGAGKTGHTFVVPASFYTPEAIVNVPTFDGTHPEDATIQPPTTRSSANPIQYGIYVVRNDDRFLNDAWGFHTRFELGNTVMRTIGYPGIHFNQYYWDHPWMWHDDDPEGIPDNSPWFVGQNQVVLYEGHGGPWVVSTVGASASDQAIHYNLISGYGGYNGTGGKTAYVIWHTCDSIPAPGDPYAFDYQSPSGPFDVWWGVFKGLRGTYGARTTVDIYDNVGPMFALSSSLGVPNLSAWLTSEANAATGHHDNWDRACAVIVSGHEGDRIYDNNPLPIPGSLTMYWQY